MNYVFNIENFVWVKSNKTLYASVISLGVPWNDFKDTQTILIQGKLSTKKFILQKSLFDHDTKSYIFLKNDDKYVMVIFREHSRFLDVTRTMRSWYIGCCLSLPS